LDTTPVQPHETLPPPHGFWRHSREVMRGAFRASVADRMTLSAAGCAFYATLALFPAMSMLISVYGLAFNRDAVASQLQALEALLPPPTFALISDRVHELISQPQRNLSAGLVISSLITLWSAGSGTKSMISALNLALGVTEIRSFLRFQLTGFAMTLGAVVVAVAAIAVLVVMPAAIAFVGLSNYSAGLLHTAALLTLVGFFLLSLLILYRFGPSRAPPSRQPLMPGAILATVLWLAASGLLSFYVSHMASFGATYGPLGAVVGVMLWFYISAYIVLLGAELNARLEMLAERLASGPGG
jgi:membrane protein